MANTIGESDFSETAPNPVQSSHGQSRTSETEQALLDRLRVLELRPEPRNWFERFTTSGLFFMLFGGSLLYLSHLTMGSAHSGLSFIMIVAGVGILLYGTGTQSIGQFGNDKYKIAIAGGAGALSLAIGYGIVIERKEINKTFQVQKRYVWLVITPKMSDDAISSSIFDAYYPLASLGGTVELPAVKHGKTIEVLVNYNELFSTDQVLELTLYQDPNIDPTRKKLGKPYERILLPISRKPPKSFDSWVDFPVYNMVATVTLKAASVDQAQAQTADRNQEASRATSDRLPPKIDLLSGEGH